MKLLRKLKPLDTLEIPVMPPLRDENGVRNDNPATPLPMHPAIEFMQAVDKFTSIKFKRRMLYAKYQELFGTLPNTKTSLELVKARVVYRLQMEGHRLTNTTPSEQFLQNYNALMTFNDTEPFKGCTTMVATLGKRLAFSERKSMSTTTVAATTEAKPAKPVKPKGPTRSNAVLGELSMCETIRYFAHRGLSIEQITAALQKLQLTAAVATIKTQYGHVKSRLAASPTVSPEVAKKLNALAPGATTKTTPVKLVAKKFIKVVDTKKHAKKRS